MKKTNKILIAVIFVVIILTQVKVYANSISDSIKPMEYAEGFRQYINLSDQEKRNIAVIPRAYDVIKQENRNPFKLARIVGATAETQYSLQSIIPENLVIKDQQETEGCWAFAELASLETNLALANHKNNVQTKYYDFSERHMEYGITRKFLNDLTNIYGFNRELGTGGNYVLASAYLTNGLGAVDEASMVFANNLDEIELSEIQNKPVTSQVLDTKEFASYDSADQTLRDQIKDYIKNYGGLTATVFGAPIFSDYYNNTTGAMYSSSTEECPITHAVTIIGWDDEYPKENFNEKHRPDSNGAWIAKNSYGTEKEYNIEDFREIVFTKYQQQCTEKGWTSKEQVEESFIKQVLTQSGYTIVGNKATIKIGDNGFWHISYQDVNIYKQMQGITKALDEVNYENIYQYNYNGAVGTIESQVTKIYLANIFTKKTTGDEYINQVALNVPEEVTCKVYVNPTGSSMKADSLQKVTLKEGESETFDAGYHTLEFLNPMKITGSSFVVMIEIQGAREDKLAYSVEARIPTEEIYNAIEIEDGKCFISPNGLAENAEWQDLSKLTTLDERNTNVDSTIKAFTVSSVPNEKVLTSIEVKTPPTKTEYIQGEDFSRTGMKVVAKYNNGEEEEITDYTIENGTNLKEEQTTVTIKYNGLTTTQAITVKKPEIAPESSNFDAAKVNIKSLKSYTYTNNINKNYVLADVEISDVVRSLNNDSYEYYYFISTNSSEENIEDWVKISEKQNSDKAITLKINSKDIKDYAKIADAEKVYIYIKEVVVKGDNQKTVISKAMEIKSNIDKAELYVDDVKYTAPLVSDSDDNNKVDKDNTTVGGKLPQTGETSKVIIAISIVCILIIVFAKKYKKYNEKM